ncbi:DUF2231 domain-containing protein [Hamadaea sp. NPDC050747]|uniref:DUF2231 domain-containing protein n=1 Tax=Hamadaea sp. NPDC050747 TaxID=3155789 RepID=UPI0033CF2130
MPETINGLPLHPLVVHAVVVLLPLAALGVIALAARPAWRRRYAGLTTLVALAATLSIPLATESGEHLERRVGDPGAHAELGDTLIWFAVPLLALAAALYWTSRRTPAAAHDADGSRPARRKVGALALSLVAIVVAIANLAQVYRIGDSGAKAVWHDTPAAATRER